MKFKTIEEATEAFVREMDAYPQDMISTLMTDHIDDWHEITKPSVGDYVNGGDGEVVKINTDNTYDIDFDGEIETLEESEFDVDRDDFLPMWGTMWAFSDSTDTYWLEEENGIQIMSDLGFRIYEHDEWGYFFGIDGAGYNFYEVHWIPLYKARGLQWHKEEKGA